MKCEFDKEGFLLVEPQSIVESLALKKWSRKKLRVIDLAGFYKTHAEQISEMQRMTEWHKKEREAVQAWLATPEGEAARNQFVIDCFKPA